MASLSRRNRNSEYTWPGYVDALSSLELLPADAPIVAALLHIRGRST